MDGIQQGIQQGYPGVAGAYAPPFAPQGFFGQSYLGNVPGAPLGGMIGNGIAGLLGQQNLNRPIGQVTNGIGGTFLPVTATDPVTAAYLQQIQLAQQAQLASQPQFVPQAQLALQGLFSNLLGSQALGYPNAGVFGNPHVTGQIGGLANQFGRFGVDPIAAQQIQQLAQQAQLAQLCQQLAQQAQIAQLAQQAQQAQIAQLAQQAQQAQFVPQGVFGNVGAQWGHPHFGGHIAGLAGQLGRAWPYQASPIGMAGGYGVPWQGLPVY